MVVRSGTYIAVILSHAGAPCRYDIKQDLPSLEVKSHSLTATEEQENKKRVARRL